MTMATTPPSERNMDTTERPKSNLIAQNSRWMSSNTLSLPPLPSTERRAAPPPTPPLTPKHLPSTIAQV